jgi:hypothetical protein
MTCEYRKFSNVCVSPIVQEERCWYRYCVNNPYTRSSNLMFYYPRVRKLTDRVCRTDTLNGMVSHVKLGHPLHIMCWVCGTSWSSLQGQVSLLQCVFEQFPAKKVGWILKIFTVGMKSRFFLLRFRALLVSTVIQYLFINRPLFV